MREMDERDCQHGLADTQQDEIDRKRLESSPLKALRIVYARVGSTPSQTVYAKTETRGDTRMGVTLIEEVLWADVPAEWQQAVLTNKLPKASSNGPGFYLETVRDEGGVPVILQVSLFALDESLLNPDMPGIEEPITTVLNMSEDAVQDAWGNSDGTWRASLDIVKSVRYDGVIPPDAILVVRGEDVVPLREVAKPKKPKAASLGM